MTSEKIKLARQFLRLIYGCLVGFFLVKYADSLHMTLDKVGVFLLALTSFVKEAVLPILPLLKQFDDSDDSDVGENPNSD